MSRILALLLAALLVPICVWGASGESISLSDVVSALETPFKGTDPAAAIYDFEADFFQESRIASLDRAQRGRGSVWFKFNRAAGREGGNPMFRWEYRQPTMQEIICDGETLWVYLPENNQVIQSDISSVTGQAAENPVTFLTGLGNLSRDFSIRWASPNRDAEGNFVLELQPRRVSQLLSTMRMVVDEDAVSDQRNLSGASGVRHEQLFPILSTTVHDPNGNSTVIEFSGIRVNRGLSDSFFNFILPAGVEVVRPEEMPKF